MGPFPYQIWLEFGMGLQKLASPFKFNSYWILEEDFQKLVKSNWTNLNEDSPAAIQFVTNLKNIKKLVSSWENSK
jgi:hypothetical protein